MGKVLMKLALTPWGQEFDVATSFSSLTKLQFASARLSAPALPLLLPPFVNADRETGLPRGEMTFPPPGEEGCK